MKIADAQDRFMSLNGYALRHGTGTAYPKVDDAPQKESGDRKNTEKKHTVSARTSHRDPDDRRREKLALDIVGELDASPEEVDRYALAKLFPELGAREGNVKEAGGTAFSWPLENSAPQRISSHFGMRKDPFTGKRAFHHGIDIAAAIGTRVLACADGVVDEVASHARLGNYVKLRHEDGSYTLYGHLSAAKVRRGQHVAAGDPLGQVGSTGRSTGPHLDFSYRLEGEAVDPLPYLNVPAHIKTLEISDASD